MRIRLSILKKLFSNNNLILNRKMPKNLKVKPKPKLILNKKKKKNI